MMGRKNLRWGKTWMCGAVAAFVLFAMPLGGARADVATDGTLGRHAQNLQGPNFTIGANLGKQAGGNLFHSFSTFNLSAGQSATFTGPASVKNVLARVTGGSPSSINGTLRCTIPDASLFLINPYGIVFGPMASLDVKGAFAATTADVVYLGQTGRFDATLPQQSVLTTAAPSAFGFLYSNPSAIIIQGNGPEKRGLAVDNGKSMTFVCGGLELDSAQLAAPAGRVNLVSVDSAGRVNANPAEAGSFTDVRGVPALGPIIAQSGSAVDVDGPAAGRILIRAGNLVMDTSSLFAQTRSAGVGGGIDIALSHSLQMTQSDITSDTTGPGRGGDVRISARAISIDGQGDAWGVFSRTASTGRGGDINVATRDLQLFSGGQITIDTDGPGDGGTLRVSATDALFDHGSATLITGLNANSLKKTNGGRAGDLIFRSRSLSILDGAFISATTGGNGDCGTVSVDVAGPLQLLRGGQIIALSLGSGRGAFIAVKARDIYMDPGGSSAITGISGSSSNPAGGGAAGDLSIDARTLQIINGGEVAVDAINRSGGGSMTIRANDIEVSGQGASFASVISATAKNRFIASAGGDLAIIAHTLNVIDGAVSTDASGKSMGGSLSIRASQVNVAGGDANQPARISARTASSAGRGGDLTINARDLTVTGYAELSASTSAKAAGGSVNIRAKSITLDGLGVAAPSIASDSNGAVSGNAGNIVIRGNALTLRDGAAISSNTQGAGAGGSVAVFANDIQLDGGGLAAIATAISSDSNGSGRAGDVSLSAATLRLTAGAAVSANAFDTGSGGNLTINAGDVILDRSTHAAITSILAVAAPGSRARAGDLTLNADNLIVLDGSQISASTFASGAGGTMRVNARNVRIDYRGSDLFTGVAADSVGGSGNAGDLHLTAGNLYIRGGEIAASTSAAGNGGNLSIHAGDIFLDGVGPTRVTAIAARNTAGSTGNAGDASIWVRSLRIVNDAQISATTFGHGNGGNLAVNAGAIYIKGDPASMNTITGIDAVANAADSGRAGNLKLIAGTLDMRDAAAIITYTQGRGAGGDLQITAKTMSLHSQSSIAANTFSAAPGGSVIVNAGRAALSGNSTISAEASATGNAGSVAIHCGSTFTLDSQSTVTTAAALSSGGGITIDAGREIDLSGHSEVSARAHLTGGNIHMTAPLFIRIFRSNVITQSGAGNGGNISIDPLELFFHESRINANGQHNGGNISLNADLLDGVRSSPGLNPRTLNVTATGQTGVSGSVNNGPANTDVARALAQLPNILAGTDLTLQPQCGQLMDVSSFIVGGRGGVPLEPGFWQMDYNLKDDASRK